MKRAVTTCVLTTALLITPLLAMPAEASHDRGFGVGAWFAIGGIDFSIVFGSRGGHPGYYYRTDDRFGYRGHRCTDRCYRDRGYGYHSLDCPMVGYHLDRYHQRPHLLFRGYAPAPWYRGSYYGDGHRGWDRGDRDRYYERHHRGHHDRYDRHDRYDHRDRRYDRHDRRDRRGRGWDRGRGRGHAKHRHSASCGHGRGHH
jgi:hypothetical protein